MNEELKLKWQLEAYEKLITRKMEVIDLISKLGSINAKDLSEENQNKVSLINQYAQDLKELNEELRGYNQEIATKRLSQFRSYKAKEMSLFLLKNDILAAESLSKNSNDFVITHNACGQKRKIDKSLLEEYKEMVKSYRILASEYKKEKIVFEGIDYNLIRKTLNEPVQESKGLFGTIKETHIKEYDELSIDEKIVETEQRMSRILSLCNKPNMGKKNLIEFNGKKYELPRCLLGQFKSTLMTLNKLHCQKEDELNHPVESNEIISPSIMPETSQAFSPNEQPIVQPTHVEEEKKGFFSNIKDKLGSFFKKFVKPKEVKEEELCTILEIQKKHKANLKKAVIALGLSVAILFSASKMSSSKINKEQIPDENKKPIESVIDDSVSVKTEVEQRFDINRIHLKDKVNIDYNTPIYRSSDEETKGTNPYQQYFMDNDERVVEGITYAITSENGNTIYQTVIATEENAQEKCDALEMKGAKAVNVLVRKTSLENSGQYEGFKDIKDVSVLIEETKGVQR